MPTVTTGPDEIICINDSVQLSANGANTYLWNPNNTITDNTISNPTVFPTTLTNYVVTGTDTNNCSNTDTLKVEVNDLPLIITSNDTVICIGDRISILASGGVTYQWLNTDSISDVSISNPQVWPSLTTDYEVVVTDLNNCIDTAEVNIQVNNLPAVNVGLDQNICKGDTALISVTGAVNYQWSPNINISSTIASSVEVWPLDSLIYIVTGVDANFCFNTDTISINILDFTNS